uniref:Uncharacterized protein n=1 Tax=Oryza sativa subsp. japonica TaxID=39947 RepID=Q8H4S5_ORYSJ|nr:hypothetical protein [Oryza sativa Japonica Group]BAC55650.1 hypothetical protein [Oryza sativa Japonica Group]
MPLASPNDQTLFLDLLFLPLASAQLGRGQTTPRYHTRQFGCDGVRHRAATTHWGGARRLAALRRTRGSSLARARKGGGRASGHRLRGGKRGVVEDEAANYAWGGGHQPAVRKEELVHRPPAGRISSAYQARGGALQHGGHTGKFVDLPRRPGSSAQRRWVGAGALSKRGKEMVVEDEAEAAQANPSTSTAATVGEEGRRDPRAPSRRRLRQRRSALCT